MSQNESNQWKDVEFIIRSAEAISDRRYEDSIHIMREGLEAHIRLNSIIESDKFLKSLCLLITAIEEEARENLEFQSKTAKKELAISVCSFCCKSKNETDILIAGANGFICGDCVINFNNFLNSRPNL